MVINHRRGPLKEGEKAAEKKAEPAHQMDDEKAVEVRTEVLSLMQETRVIQMLSSFNNLDENIAPASFEKDDDSNKHILRKPVYD